MGVATGNYHSLAWDANGSIYSWGDSTEGKLGHGILIEEQTINQIDIFPKKIESLEGKFVI